LLTNALVSQVAGYAVALDDAIFVLGGTDDSFQCKKKKKKKKKEK
jgi:hypothetical protein